MKQEVTFSAEDMYQILRGEILSLVLVPGSLISENLISERFHTSRTPVRGVFAHLGRDNLLSVIPKSGTYVSLIDLERAFQSLYIRIQVETAVMEELARHGNSIFFSQLENNLDQQKEAIDKGIYPESWYRIDSQFHAICMASVGREQVWEILQNLSTDYTRYRNLDYLAANKADRKAFESLYEEHLTLFKLMKEHDADSIRYAVTNHLYSGIIRRGKNFQEKYEQYLTPSSHHIKEILLNIKLQLKDAQNTVKHPQSGYGQEFEALV